MATDTVQQIKDKLSIVDVVTPYVKLTKAGRLYRGLTPFGKEKTPSFYVNPERGSYYCFSTSQGGDQFTFIEKMEGLDFKGALKFLADKAGVQIVAHAPGADMANDRKDRLREMVSAAETFFAEQLTPESPAYTYAVSRGVMPETIVKFRMGFAPAGWRGLLEALEAKGYTAKELVAAGLIKEADGKPGTWYDRFRNRLMFPIRDAAGRTVAFTGRALPAEDGTIDPAKYLNSPETDLFKKSDVLFGMDLAKDAIRTRGFAILVEGQFDVVLLHQAGFTNTIALSGTALSTMHLSYIKRYAENLMLCLDADRAGLAASAKTARAALMNGMRVKAVRMPQGKDPADVVSEDPKAFTSLLQNAQSIIEFLLGVLSDLETDDLRRLRAVEGVILPLVVAVRSPLERNRFVDIIARTISSTPEAVRESLPRPEVQPQESATQNDRQNEDSETSGKAQASGPSTPLSAQEHRRNLLLAAAALYPETPLAARIKSEYNRILDLLAGNNSAPARNEDPDERALFEAGIAFGETPEEHSADDMLRVFERHSLTDELRHASNALRRAESNKDADQIRTWSESCRTISARLGQLH